jgi:hypothetical protein
MGLDQLQAAPSLNVLGAGRTGAQCDHPGGFCREVPDVAADADPNTGYAIYWSGGDAGEPSGWQSIGGTSAAAPVWAALMTLADASAACAGNPLGFAGPALYRAAGSGYTGNFNDVRAGSNDFTATNGGAFTAGVGYDEASGLGSPNGAPLASALCVDTLRLVSPGTPRLTAHAVVSLGLRAEDPRGVGIDFHASGLPPGLSMNQTSGTISGRPRRPGSFLVQVGAQDAQGATSSTSFTVNVGAAPRVSRTSVSGLRPRRRIAFAATAGRGAPAFERLSVALPRGLKLTSTRGVVLMARGVRRPRFRARHRHGSLQITLRRSLSQLTLSLSRPGLRVTSTSRPRPGKHGRGAGSLALVIVDAGSGTSHLHSKLAHSP